MSNIIHTEKVLTRPQVDELLTTLKQRFHKYQHRHQDVAWEPLQARLEESTPKLWSLYQMEVTGGEPDLVYFDKNDNLYTFFDCSVESPKERRSLCYDGIALQSRKEHKPKNSVVDLANEMGIELLSEDQYRQLQQMGNVDTKTSSWIKTLASIRELGGALFCDRRYNHVFVYHNGAESYYAARGFRGCLTL